MNAERTPAALASLLGHPAIWRRGDRAPRGAPAPGVLPSSFSELDRLLPDGGWPAVGLTELLRPRDGSGELTLLVPALARLTRQGRRVAWVAPPLEPYAPALARAGVDLSRLVVVRAGTPGDGLWAMEQLLRSGSCGAVLAWPEAAEERALRRLQLAAEQGRSWALLVGSPDWLRRPSPARLRLGVAPGAGGTMRVRIHKCRGGAPSGSLELAPPPEGDAALESLPP